MEFNYLKAYAAFILDTCLDKFVRIHLHRVKEVQLPLLKLFATFTDEQLYTFSSSTTKEFLQSLAAGKAMENARQRNDLWKGNLLPNVPRNSIDVKDMAFTPHTRKYAFIRLLKEYTQDLDLYEAVIQELELFYSLEQEMSLQTFVDIQNEQVIHEKEFLSTLLDNTSDGISAYDQEGKITLWNKALEERTGVSKAQAIGQKLFNLFSQYEGTVMQQAIEKVRNGEKVFLHDVPLAHRTGYYEASLTPLIDKNGQTIGWLTVSRDITARKLAEEKLQKSEEVMAQAQSIAHVGSWEWEATTGKVTWSDELYRIFGYQPQPGEIDISKKWLFQHIHPDSMAEVEKIYSLAVHHQGAFEATVQIIRQDKRVRITHTKGMIVCDDTGRRSKIFGSTQDVTEEKEAQKLIQGVLNGSLAGLIYFQSVRSTDESIIDFEYVLVNNAAYHHLKRKESLVGKRMLEVYPELQQADVFRKFTLVVDTGKPYADTILFAIENKPVWFKLYAVKQSDGLVLSFEDITATKESEEKLQKEKDFSDSLIFHSIDGIVSLDENLRYTAWNPVMEQYIGKSRSQVLGQHVLDVFPGTENSEALQAMKAALRGIATKLSDREFTSRKGYYDAYIFPLYGAHNHIAGIMSIVHDVTERKQNQLTEHAAQEEIRRKNQELAHALDELRQYKDHLVELNLSLEEKIQERTKELVTSENQLRLVSDALPLLVSYIDAQQRYKFTNKAYSDWFKKPLNAIQGRTMRELLGDETYLPAAPYIEKVLQGEHVTYDTSFTHAEKGDRYVTVTYVPHLDHGKTAGFYAIIFDITERVKSEQALQAAFKETELKNQELSKINEVLDNFVYMAAHDLKSPVANLKLLSGMLVRVDSPVHPELHAAIVESVNRLDQTINGLVEVIEVQSVHDIPVKEVAFQTCLQIIIQDLADEIRSTGSQIEIDFSQKDTVRYVEAYLQSILKNLLTNAIKYRSTARNLHVHIQTKQEKEYVLLTVSDNGMGMNLAKYGQHVFKPFTRFTNKASGKGLGLHLIKSMVEKNGGKVLVDSEVEKGTTFRIYLKEY
jgi:PAS domain S-box-containing protein